MAAALLLRALARGRLLRACRWLLVLVALPVVARLAFALTPATWWVDPARFVQPHDALTVVDRDGRLLRHARADGVDRRWVTLDDVSPAGDDPSSPPTRPRNRGPPPEMATCRTTRNPPASARDPSHPPTTKSPSTHRNPRRPAHATPEITQTRKPIM